MKELRELVAKWLGDRDPGGASPWEHGYDSALTHCATDLEAALAAEPPGGWVRIEDVIAAVDAEGEPSGLMSDSLREHMFNDPEEVVRATVCVTKRGIRNRIMTHARLIDPPPEVPHD